MRLRKAESTDLADLARLERETLEHPWTEAQLGEELLRADARVLIATEGAEVLGFALARLGAGVLELLRIGVDHAHRHRGIGGTLLAGVVQAAREAKADEVWLEVRAGNLAAVALYRKAGFEQVGRRPHYYEHPPDDALLFRCRPGTILTNPHED